MVDDQYIVQMVGFVLGDVGIYVGQEGCGQVVYQIVMVD